MTEEPEKQVAHTSIFSCSRGEIHVTYNDEGSRQITVFAKDGEEAKRHMLELAKAWTNTSSQEG